VDATSAQTLASLAMVLRRMDVELILTRVTKPSIRRLLVAHGIISPADGAADSHRSSSSAGGHVPGGAGGDHEEQQPLLADQDEETTSSSGYCKVFDTLSGAAKYAEDRCVVCLGVGPALGNCLCCNPL